MKHRKNSSTLLTRILIRQRNMVAVPVAAVARHPPDALAHPLPRLPEVGDGLLQACVLVLAPPALLLQRVVRALDVVVDGVDGPLRDSVSLYEPSR